MVNYKQVKGFVGYKVGDDGSVWTNKKPGRYGGKLDYWKRMQGNRHYYHQVRLRHKGKLCQAYVHRLVLEAFVGPCPEGMECRHLDNNKLNNRLSNICWGTKQENAQDKKRHGTELKGSELPCSKLTKEQVEWIRRHFIPYHRKVGNAALARRFKVCGVTIYMIVNYRTWNW